MSSKHIARILTKIVTLPITGIRVCIQVDMKVSVAGIEGNAFTRTRKEIKNKAICVIRQRRMSSQSEESDLLNH